MADIVLDRLSKRFGPVSAVDRLSLTVKDGEFVVLLGPTGAGKTTTLRLAAGLEQPDEGRVEIAGEDMTGRAPAERDLAFVFQQYSLYPHYTVFDNLAFPLRSPKMSWPRRAVDERVREIAALLRLESKLANRATELSGGEMQRVAIGRALVRKPAAFLMDEPLSSLDAKLREDLRVELKRIQLDLGATILYVTHDQTEAMTLADRIGVLSEGRLVQIGTPRDIYTRPDTVEVALRLGSPRINLLPRGALGLANGPDGAKTVGIRPEDVLVGQGGVAATVVTAEHLGAETVLALDADDHRVLALAGPGMALGEGEATTVAARDGAALYFDDALQRIRRNAPDRPTAGEVSHG